MTNETIIVGLGEALWDVLPSGRVLGGAPLNVACHAQQLLHQRGGQGVVASRVGRDALGDEVVRQLQERGMTADFVQRDSDHATSTVRVHLEAGQPTYTFTPNIAWDHLEFTLAWAKLAARCSAVCFGTLAQRSTLSRQTIWQFLDAAKRAVRMFDVNLRQGFYDRESIVEGCRRATLVKLNEHELPVVAECLGLPAGPPNEQIFALREQHEIEAVIFTRGKLGTLLVQENETVDAPPVSYPAAPNADAVGAGDACSAAVLAGWLSKLPPARIVELANLAGAYVASQPGATPNLPTEITDRLI